MADFEPDPYIERLIKLRETDPLAFAILHPEVKKLIEEYEQEKTVAQMADAPSHNQDQGCGK
jgi:hypothetical protein